MSDRTAGQSAEDWKRDHAEASELAAVHPIVEDVLTEFAGNMGFKREGLPEYGLAKIVATVAQVVRARTLGFDPDLLRMTRDEAEAQMLAQARRMVAAGKPVLRVDADDITRLD